MIVTVTLNPALDLTYGIDALVVHGTHRVATVAERAGGKGLNVARVLHALGEPVLATGLLGGPTGARVSELLAYQGVAASFVPITGETRRTVAVVDAHDATGFWEPGPIVPASEWIRFVGHFHDLMRTTTVVALCGSLPPGVPADAYGILIRIAAAAGVVSVLDTSGEALRRALRAHPEIAKPNVHELSELVPDLSVARIRALSRGAIVVSRGPDGLLAVTPDGVHESAPHESLAGNPTGAGDACVAALARGLRDRVGWPDLLADAVALSAAAVATPVAGAFDPDVYQRMLTTPTPPHTAASHTAPPRTDPPRTDPPRTDPSPLGYRPENTAAGAGNSSEGPYNASPSARREPSAEARERTADVAAAAREGTARVAVAHGLGNRDGELTGERRERGQAC
ncbi:hexose kinase [Actinoplanes bogorensis]|uniref:Hexose kinase n=1 Tax=Paractinoplanes bogorensis TaxID=1610840 RepID=A0ABS5Z3Y4_9ACTN|nr:1-phosphofructokinase family hexose kinase [Actinoplanes bogorensis]MBU2670405.1 hexose kinase [Actinoplanes bogorensis]